MDTTYKLGDTNITIYQSNGYMNLMNLCKSQSNVVFKWKKLKSTQELMSEISKKTGLLASDLTYKKRKDGYLEFWVHNDLVTSLIENVEPLYVPELEEWIEKWVEESKIKDTVKEVPKTQYIIKKFKDDKNNVLFNIRVRSDGYVDASGLCKVSGKILGNWRNLKQTKELVSKYPDPDSLFQVQRGNGSFTCHCTWIHPSLVRFLAEWCAPTHVESIEKLLSEESKEDSEDNESKEENDDIVYDELNTNNYSLAIEQRKDGFINASKLLKTGKKCISDWLKYSETKKTMASLCSNLNCKKEQIIYSLKDRKFQGTWVLPKLAVQLVDWITPLLTEKMKTWITDHEIKNVEQELKIYNRELKNEQNDVIAIVQQRSDNGFINVSSMLKIYRTHRKIVKNRHT